MRKQQAIQHIQEDLERMPEVLCMCLAILDYICSQPEQNLRYITFGALSRAANLTHVYDVIPASRYLCGARVPVLNPEFEFIDGDFVEPISIKEVSEAREHGVFYHPHTGELVEDFEKMLFMHFSLSPDGMELRRT